MSLRLQQACAAWLEVADLDDAALAQRIHSDGIDVLVDLSGHTRNNRLAMLAWKPAPVQISWLGYCGTTGIDLVDAFLADPWIAPACIEPDHAEPIVRLPETFLCFTPPAAPMIVGPLPALSGRSMPTSADVGASRPRPRAPSRPAQRWTAREPLKSRRCRR